MTDIMIWEKLKEIEEKIDNLTDSMNSMLESVEERETDVDEEEEEDSGEALPPINQETKEKEVEEVEAPEIVTPGQQVSKAEMRALNKPGFKPKAVERLVPTTKEEEAKWEDEFKE